MDKEYATIAASVTKADGEDRTYRFLGTTAVRDRMGDEIPLTGWEFGNYLKNPVFLWGHNYFGGPQNVIGRALNISRRTVNGVKGWAFDIEFVPEDINPTAEMCRRLVDEGYLGSVSVGFKSIKSKRIEESEQEELQRSKDRPDDSPGKIFEKKELLELSLVPVPANPEALIAARQRGLEVPKEVDTYLNDWVVKKSADALARTREIKAELQSSNDLKDYMRKITEELGDDGSLDAVTKPDWDDDPKYTEIHYRVRDPGGFQKDSFRRVPLQKKKPRVIAVMGRLKGETTMTIQSLRFPKADGWTVSAAKTWVKDHPDAVKHVDMFCFGFDVNDLPDEKVLDDYEALQDAFSDICGKTLKAANPEEESSETSSEGDERSTPLDEDATPSDGDSETAEEYSGWIIVGSEKSRTAAMSMYIDVEEGENV